VKRAVMINEPTQIAVTFIDYIDHANAGACCYSDLTVSAKQFIEQIEHETQVPVTLISTGAHTAHIIDLRKARQSEAGISHWLVCDSD
jgi:adenylosuccinate synthase